MKKESRSTVARHAPLTALAAFVVGAFAIVGALQPAQAQSFGSLMKKALQQPAPAQAQAAPAATAAPQTGADGQPPAPPPNRSWLGYSQQFQALRPMLLQGDFAAAKIAYETGKDAAGAPIPLPANPVPAAAPGQQQPPAGANLFASLAAASRAQAAANGATGGAPTTAGVMQPLAQSAAPFITNVETGTLLLDSGDVPAARAAFDSAGSVGATSAQSDTRNTGARVGGAFRAIGRAAASAAGNAELGAYNAPDYERVLQLNYLALSYLLLGDDKAFNVSQRGSAGQREAFESLNDKAAKLQDEARAAFEAERAEAQAKLADAQQNPDQKASASAVDTQLAAAYATEDFCTAPNLPSAFVNPLSFYLNGIVYEVSSTQFPEDRDTARISYEKALQLAPEAGVLSAAVRDLNSQQVRPGRLVHVIVGEGFAPTRQAIRMQLTLNNIVAPITIPRLTCHPSDIAAIEVRTTEGRVLSRLDTVANIEGIMLQRQKDRESLTAAAVFTNALRGALENRMAQGNLVLGLLAQAKQESFDRPDMRSWSTLPARVHGGRVYVPNDVSEVDIVSLNAQRQVIGSSRARLDTQSRQNVVYARAVQAKVAVAPTAQLWIRGL
jgi:hypothetical protein